MNEQYDVIVLGGGPGGYPAAVRLSQSGKRVALIERTALGGTCLNRGCIPSKALLAHAERLLQIKNAQYFNINTGTCSFDFEKIAKDRDSAVAKLLKGLEGTVTSWGVDVIYGTGSFIGPKTIEVKGEKKRTLTAPTIIIATGTEPRELPGMVFDGSYIHSSTSILKITKLPKRITIIGGGVIGCEFASFFQAFDVEVSIIEALDRILPFECEYLSQALAKDFTGRKIKIQTGAFVDKIEKTDAGVSVKLKDGTNITADIALVGIGRAFNTSDIGLQNAGVEVAKGILPVNDRMQTNVQGIYAIGDIVGKAMYAHVATHQGLVAAANILGEDQQMHYNAIPGVLFTHPEIASVGLSLKDALQKGVSAKRVQYPYQALGKAHAVKETYGFAALVYEEKTHAILGAQIIGANASDLILPITMAISNELVLESITTETIYPHPTFSEIWSECAFLALGKPLNFPAMR